jgi:hypothetical protein
VTNKLDKSIVQFQALEWKTSKAGKPFGSDAGDKQTVKADGAGFRLERISRAEGKEQDSEREQRHRAESADMLA